MPKLTKDPRSADNSPLVCAHVKHGACDRCQHPLRPRYIYERKLATSPAFSAEYGTEPEVGFDVRREVRERVAILIGTLLAGF